MHLLPRSWLLGRLLLGLLALAGPAVGAAPKTHLDYRAEARAAYERKDYAAARAAARSALALRPDSPRYLHLLAACAALAGDSADAIRHLQRLAALGVAPPVDRDPDFASLQGTAPFRQVIGLLDENRAPRGEAQVFAELPGRTGIIEGIAFRPRTGDIFLSDVHHRCIWRRDRTGQVTRFSDEDEELLGLFGLALDEARGSLYAAMSAVPEMAGYTAQLDGAAGLVEFNLATGEIRRVVAVPSAGRAHGLGDLLVAPDGTVYATDAKAPVIWKLAPEATDFEKLAESPDFISLQGLVLWRNELIFADYANGLFAVEIASGRVRPFAPPANTTLVGLDGLVAVPDAIVATQNGVEPPRVVKIAFAPDAAAVTEVVVLASAVPHLEDISLITLVNDLPTFIAGSGWEGFDPAQRPVPRPHPVRLLQVALPGYRN